MSPKKADDLKKELKQVNDKLNETKKVIRILVNKLNVFFFISISNKCECGKSEQI